MTQKEEPWRHLHDTATATSTRPHQAVLSASTLETTDWPLTENLLFCPQSQIQNESRLPADDSLLYDHKKKKPSVARTKCCARRKPSESTNGERFRMWFRWDSRLFQSAVTPQKKGNAREGNAGKGAITSEYGSTQRGQSTFLNDTQVKFGLNLKNINHY